MVKKLKNLNIDILVEDERWNTLEFSYEEILEKAIRLTLEDDSQLANKFQNKEIEVSIVLTNDKSIQKLNKEYRNKDKPTNVLSFPMFEDLENELGKSSESKLENELDFSELILLGDIILSYEIIQNEAKEQKKSFENHIIHLIIHSMLHLLGCNHETGKQAGIMENKEIKLLSKLKIKDPYNVT